MLRYSKRRNYRCTECARSWIFGALEVVNLFAYYTNPFSNVMPVRGSHWLPKRSLSTGDELMG